MSATGQTKIVEDAKAGPLATPKAGLVWLEEKDLEIVDVLDSDGEAKRGNYFTSGWVAIVKFKGKPNERWFCKGILDEDMQRWLDHGKVADPKVQSKIKAILTPRLEKRKAAIEEASKKGKTYDYGEIRSHMALREAYTANNIFHLYLPDTQPEVQLIRIEQQQHIPGVDFNSYLVLSKEVVGYTPLVLADLTKWKEKLKANKIKNLGMLITLSIAANEMDLNMSNIGYIESGDEWILVRIDFGCCFTGSPQQFDERFRKHMRFEKTARSIDAAPFLANIAAEDQPRYQMYTSFDIWVKGWHLISKYFDVTILDNQQMIDGKHLALLFLILTSNKVVNAYDNYPAVLETDDYVKFGKRDITIKEDLRKIAAEVIGFTDFYFQATQQYFSSNGTKGPIAVLKGLLQAHVGIEPLIDFDAHVGEVSALLTSLSAQAPEKKENKDETLEALLRQAENLEAEVQQVKAMIGEGAERSDAPLVGRVSSRVGLVAPQVHPMQQGAVEPAPPQEAKPACQDCREACGGCLTVTKEFFKALFKCSPTQEPAQVVQLALPQQAEQQPLQPRI